MSSNDIYNNLVVQYEQLSLTEKQAILIYKSKLFNLLNLITSIDGFKNMNTDDIITKLPNIENLKQEVLNFRNVLDLKENMVVKYSIFNLVDLNDFSKLIDDLRNVYFILEEASAKLVLDTDLTVFRGISLNKNDNFVDLARGNIISTSIKHEDVEPFLTNGDNSILYVINIKKGVPLLVSPISLVRTYKDEDDYLEKKLSNTEPTLLKVMNRGSKGQQEIILFKDQLVIENIKTEKRSIDNTECLVYYIDAIYKKEQKESFLSK